MKFIALGAFIIIFGVDTTCQYILEKTIPKYKRNLKAFIAGYNIYMYYKWRKEIKK